MSRETVFSELPAMPMRSGSVGGRRISDAFVQSLTLEEATAPDTLLAIRLNGRHRAP